MIDVTGHTHLTYQNVNYGFGIPSHTNQIQESIDSGSRIITYSELDDKIDFEGFRNFHPSDEGMYVKDGFKVRYWTHVDCSENKFGQKIGNRQFVVMRGRFPTIGAAKVITGHMPHPRMGEEIYNAYASTLRRLISRSRVPCMVSMDSNKHVDLDPCHLHRDFGGHWFGSRIDLWWVDSRIKVLKHWEDLDPTRKDRHPIIHIVV